MRRLVIVVECVTRWRNRISAEKSIRRGFSNDHRENAANERIGVPPILDERFNSMSRVRR